MAADASYMPARLGAGLVHFDEHRYSIARNLFAEAHRLQPNAADPLYFLAQCHEMVNVSLQKNPPAADLADCTFSLTDWTDDISDFGDTAAIMQGLDLVISIDSAPAHLAGALGVPVWLLNRYDGEWRWGRARSDNDWYQSMRVFYQSTQGDWAAVFRQMATSCEAT